MNVIITQNERGFVFRNGIYRKMMQPGKHKVRVMLGETFAKIPVGKAVEVPGADIEVLLKDKAFAESVTVIEVPDGSLAARFEDGRICGMLSPGKYCFFTCYRKIEFKLIDLSALEVTGLTPEQLARIPEAYYTKITVAEGETGLLFINGKYSRALCSGSYYFWNTKSASILCEKVDIRAQQLEITGQEILTADKVSLRVNFTCSYRVTDAVKISSEIKDYKAQIYTVTQLALRQYIGAFRFDELLDQKESVADAVLSQLRAKQAGIYVEFISAGLKDIILPGEIRDIMNTVLVAEKNAQANVVARREEVASTRSLLNTAKLLDENATLYKLKEFEYIEKICDKVGSISVGGGSLITELQKIIGTGR